MGGRKGADMSIRSGGWRRARGFVTAGFVAAVSVLGIAMRAGAAEQLVPPVVTPGIQVNREIVPTRIHYNQQILVDPTDPNTLVIVESNLATNLGGCPVHVSRDRGRTWSTQKAEPKPPEFGTCIRASFGPAMAAAFGRDGTLYVHAAGAPVAMGLGVTDPYVARSRDLGATWEFTTIVRGSEEVEFTRVDGTKVKDTGRYNRLSLTTHPTDPSMVYAGMLINPGNLAILTAAPIRSLVAVSSDGGRTFGPPVDIFKDTPPTEIYGSDVPALAVDKNGVIYAFTKERPPAPAGATAPTAPPPVATPTTEPPPPTTAPLAGAGCPPAPARTQPAAPASTVPPVNTQLGAAGAGDRLLFAKSTDGGKTWTGRSIDDSTAICRFCLTTPQAGINTKTGEVFVVFEQSDVAPPVAREDRNIFFMSSADGGATFSKRVRLNDDLEPNRKPGFNQVFPNLSVAPNGRIDVVWFDFRSDGMFNGEGTGRSDYLNETCWDAYYTYSNDSGRTWAEQNLRISDRSMNKDEGISVNPAYGPMGPMGIASSDGAAYVAWPDSRAGRPLVPLQDTYFASVLFEEPTLPSDSSLTWSSVVLGVGIGLAAAGLVALAVGARLRRSREGPGAEAGAG
ncbi:MAG: sialidase family protein [Acidimicrobiales bacterium]